MADPESKPTTPAPILTLPNSITVRPYTQRDIPSLARHGNNKRIWDHLRDRMPHPYREDDAADWINRVARNPIATGPWTPETGSSTGPKTETHFAIDIGGEAVGSIGLEFGDPGDVYARSAEIGYWLGETHWGKGVMSGIVRAFVRWAFGTFGILVRLNAEVNEGNVGSRRVLEQAGFRVEGRRERGIVKNAAFIDILYLGLLRPELDGC